MKKRILPLLSLGFILPVLSGCSDEMAETLADAGQNTIIGMGVVFLILILISLVISAFKLIGTAQEKNAKRKEAKQQKNAPAPVPAPASPVQEADAAEDFGEEEDAADDMELIAVIAAAIAASENTDPSGIVVRSIRKVSSANNWKRG